MATAYSYIRFSSPEQSKGHSLQRQLQSSIAYANQHNLILDESLNLHDLGVSAFKGDNVASGKLGAFIDAVDSGHIEAGSVLLVESLDRLSRDEVITSLNRFTAILERNITIVTLSDNRTYTRSNLNDIGNLLTSLIIMSRAHEESATKSLRLKAAWSAKKVKAETNKTPMSKICPAWLELVDGAYQVKAGAGETIKTIFELHSNGYGAELIARHLNQHFPVFGFRKNSSGWQTTYIRKILTNTSVYGLYNNIPDYYPAVISEDEFNAAQQTRLSRRKQGACTSEHYNILAHLCKCGVCKGTMIKLNKSTRYRGKYERYITMVCKQGRMGLSDCKTTGWRLDELEQKILNLVTELDVSALVGADTDNNVKMIEQMIASNEYQLTELNNNKNNLVQAITIGGDIQVLVKKLQEIEGNISEKTEQVSLLKQQLVTEQNKFKELNGVKNLVSELQGKLEDNDVRRKLNNELKKIITQINLFNEKKLFNIKYKNDVLKVEFKSGKQIILE